MVHIEVMSYRGKNGGYAKVHIPLWIARIVGTDGTKRPIDQSTWHGYSDEAAAMRLAESWSRFLGISIHHVDGNERLDGRPPE